MDSAHDRGIHIASQYHDDTNLHMSTGSLQIAIISFDLDTADLGQILISVN